MQGTRVSKIVAAVLIVLGGMAMTVTVTDSPKNITHAVESDLRTTAGDHTDGDVTWGP
ncbi:hypothetical protein ACIRPU_28495 [Streptomyces sp. NPDC102259]|uniref:hypothetical protein n=1 Tax=Streptomyces sp. NPDC102259 TaxID=3366148 RepID=UPI0037F7D5AD